MGCPPISKSRAFFLLFSPSPLLSGFIPRRVVPSSGNFRNDYHRDIPTAPIDSTEKMKFQLFPLSRFSFYLSISFLAPCLSLSSLLKGKLLNSDDAGRGRLGDEGGGGEGEGVGRNRRGGAYLKDRQMAQVNASAQRSMRSLLFK